MRTPGSLPETHSTVDPQTPWDPARQQAAPNDPIRRAKQVLGKTGDFWALVDMVRNVASCEGVLDEIRQSVDTLRALVQEQKQLETEMHERAKSHTVAVNELAAFTEQQRKLRDADTVAALKRTNDLNLRDEATRTTEQAQSQRENGLAARESRLAKDVAELDLKAAHDAEALASRQSALDHAKAEHADRVAAFERRFAAAKAILAAVPDAHEVAATVLASPDTRTHAAPKQATDTR